jgi:hypothetical protein
MLPHPYTTVTSSHKKKNPLHNNKIPSPPKIPHFKSHIVNEEEKNQGNYIG